jgi:hypothetical protein
MSNETFTPAELAAHRADAAAGKTPTLEIVRKFILTIRKTFLASPKAVEKGKTTRNVKPKLLEDQVDFF